MGIKDQVADVTAQTTDIGAKVVTNAKINLDVGKWASGSWVSGSQTIFTGTSAFTVLQIFCKVTAAAQGLVTFKVTAGTVIMSCSTSGSFTYNSNPGAIALNSTIHVFTATNTLLPDVSAGGSILATAVNTTAGKWYMQYIETQT